jgi:DNA modification methylase
MVLKPYYDHAGITIYHGDCREYFDQMKRARAYRDEMRTAAKTPSSNDVMSLLGLADWESEVIDFDLCLTDPPYGIQMSKGFEGFGGFGPPIPRRQYSDSWDSERPTIEVFSLLIASAVTSIIWGGNFFADLLPRSTHWLVWDKLNTMPSFGDCELAWTNIGKKSVKKLTVEWNGLMGREPFRDHPTQKPVKLMKLCLSFAPDAKTVIDPLMGSGSVLVAAKHRGLTAVGIDMEEKYCEIAARRLSQEVFDFG